MNDDVRAVMLRAADDLANALADRTSLTLRANESVSPSATVELASIVGAAGVAEGVLRSVAAMLDEMAKPTTARIDVPRDERGRFRPMKEQLADLASSVHVHMDDGKPLHPGMMTR